MLTQAGHVETAAPSGVVTFLFSDIEGSTRRWSRDRAAMQEAVRTHDRLMRAAIVAGGGRVFKTMGDSFCAAFPTPETAVIAALAAQRALGAADFTAVDGLRVRMAMNTGTADERDGDYFGPSLNRVARLLVLGHGGQVLLSNATASLVGESLPKDASLLDLGEYELKDLEGHERVYQLIAPELQSNFPDLRSQKALAPWLATDVRRAQHFTGREALLSELQHELAERHQAVLCGPQGAGATQVAIEYAVRHRDEYPNGVFFVNAETRSGLTNGFVDIAKTLHLAAAESDDQEAVVNSVVALLNRGDRWLLILDNVEDPREIERSVDGRAGDVLITSRESATFGPAGIPHALDVSALSDAEALAFLLARTGRGGAPAPVLAGAARLCRELGNVALALEHAAAYIVETNASFAFYRGAFRRSRDGLAADSHDPSGIVAATSALNLSKVETIAPAAAEMLRIGALLGSESIPFEIFLDGAAAIGGSIAQSLDEPDDLRMAELLRPLVRYSLVQFDALTRGVRLHRLVRHVVWAAVPDSRRRAYVARAVRAVEAAFPEGAFATWAQCERLLPHVDAVALWLDAYDVQPEAAGHVLNRAGKYLYERGRYDEARLMHERALGIWERAEGLDCADVARSLNNLANVNWAQGRHLLAGPMYERSLAIWERALGPEHPHAAYSLTGLANVFLREGRHDLARGAYERALTIRERALGPDHPYVAFSLDNLATVDAVQGRYANARLLQERALAIREKALGPDHPDVANSLNNLGLICRDQGRYAEAERLLERAIVIWERALGPDHQNLSHGLDSLVEVYWAAGKFAEAEALYERALLIRERAHGFDHPPVAQPLNGLANVFSRDGRYREAEPLAERAALTTSATGLAGLTARLGKQSTAEPLFERALASWNDALLPNHARVSHALAGLAALREGQGRNAEAIALYERALAIKTKAFDRDHPDLTALRKSIEGLRSAG